MAAHSTVLEHLAKGFARGVGLPARGLRAPILRALGRVAICFHESLQVELVEVN